MIEFPPIKLPLELTNILQHCPLIDNSYNKRIEHYIRKSSSLPTLIEKTFSALHPNHSLSSLLDLLGPKNFRDRLTSLYLQYFKFGKFPHESNLNYVNSILQNEAEYSFYTMGGHSRVFLLFFYLEAIQLKSQNEAKKMNVYELSPSIKKYLRSSKQKIKEIDYIIIMLMHFHEFIGESKLSSFFNYLSPFRSFAVLWRLLTPSQQRILMRNVIHYTYSINDHMLFEELL